VGGVRALGEGVHVLRAGKVTGSCDPQRESESTLARMMIGADLPHPRHHDAAPRDGGALSLHKVSVRADDPFGTDLLDVSLSVHAGEIVGIAGVSGNGQKELLAVLSGERTLVDAGAIELNGVRAGKLDAAARRALGLVFVPEERLGRGAIPEMSLAENALLTAFRQGLVRH